MSPTVRVEHQDNVAMLTLSRPERLNAFDEMTIATLAAAVGTLSSDPSVRAIVLTGDGRAFCAGLDVVYAAREISTQSTPLDGLMRRVINHLHTTISELRRAPKPVLTVVNGVAAGAGVGLALAGDLVVASEGASFSLAYSRMGLAPDGGATWVLPRLVGEKRALALLMTSEVLTAVQAKNIGLVTHVFPDDELQAEARRLARDLAAGPTQALALCKSLILDSLREGLETQMEAERRAIMATFRSGDFMEGISAFLARQPPNFKGK